MREGKPQNAELPQSLNLDTFSLIHPLRFFLNCMIVFSFLKSKVSLFHKTAPLNIKLCLSLEAASILPGLLCSTILEAV